MKLILQAIKIILFSHLLVASAQAQTPLKFCFEDTPQSPWTMPDGSGLSIELLKRVEEILGERFEFMAKPWKRCQEEVRLGVLDGYFGAAVSAERLHFSVYPSLDDGTIDLNAALNNVQTRLFMRAQSEVSWDGKKLQHVRQAIVVQRGYLIGSLLQKQGFKIYEVGNVEEALHRLRKGDADLAILQGMDAVHLSTREPRFKGGIQIHSLPFMELPLYLAVNRSVFKQNPKRIQTIWSTIKSERHSASYQQLVESTGAR
nr:transporter substrate-binding domain-containing protein [uncultured Undibacterium sp.]